MFVYLIILLTIINPITGQRFDEDQQCGTCRVQFSNCAQYSPGQICKCLQALSNCEQGYNCTGDSEMIKQMCDQNSCMWCQTPEDKCLFPFIDCSRMTKKDNNYFCLYNNMVHV